jgi:hypothetical protein
MQKQTKTVLLIIGLIALIAAFAAIYHFAVPKVVGGSKRITIEVINDKKEISTYTVKTNANYLQGAMDETEGLSYSGSKSQYGLTLETINGLTANFNTSNTVWSIYINGEYATFGISEQPIYDGDVIRFEYSTY